MSAAQAIGHGIHDAVYECAVALARKHELLDEDGRLLCWQCRRHCPWHLSLHCDKCRAEEKRTRPERRQREIAEQRAERERQREESRLAQRVRSFRDEY